VDVHSYFLHVVSVLLLQFLFYVVVRCCFVQVNVMKRFLFNSSVLFRTSFTVAYIADFIVL